MGVWGLFVLRADCSIEIDDQNIRLSFKSSGCSLDMRFDPNILSDYKVHDMSVFRVEACLEPKVDTGFHKSESIDVVTGAGNPEGPIKCFLETKPSEPFAMYTGTVPKTTFLAFQLIPSRVCRLISKKYENARARLVVENVAKCLEAGPGKEPSYKSCLPAKDNSPLPIAGFEILTELRKCLVEKNEDCLRDAHLKTFRDVSLEVDILISLGQCLLGKNCLTNEEHLATENCSPTTKFCSDVAKDSLMRPRRTN